ncbi:MAG: HAD-IIB family hydrolase [Euryarchaeota archaeon]|nr:HAD-IIB family hydrolase [Euryarchaeota archaeon]
MKIVLITDLDGTLLDETYDYKPIEKFINKLKSYGVDIVFSSSKTFLEQEYYRKALGINDPFVVEMGGAIYIPKEYFSHIFPRTNSSEKYHIIEYGLRIEILNKILEDVEKVYGLKLKRFTKMPSEEISKVTGLPLEMAEWAKKRQYSEVIVRGFPEEEDLREILRKYFHLNVFLSKRLLTIIGNTDKGIALRILENLYYEEYGSVEMIAAGDGEADIPMLLAADLGIYVSKDGKVPELLMNRKNIVVVNCREDLMKFIVNYVEKLLL